MPGWINLSLEFSGSCRVSWPRWRAHRPGSDPRQSEFHRPPSGFSFLGLSFPRVSSIAFRSNPTMENFHDILEETMISMTRKKETYLLFIDRILHFKITKYKILDRVFNKHFIIFLLHAYLFNFNPEETTTRFVDSVLYHVLRGVFFFLFNSYAPVCRPGHNAYKKAQLLSETY